jgi:hypothetical protein
MSFTLHFPDEQYTLVVDVLPEEGETIDLVRGLTLTRRNGILHLEGVVVPAVQDTTVSLLETQ